MLPQLEQLSAAWLANPWLLWGAGPMAAVAAGFLVTAFALEAAMAAGWFESAQIVYPTASGQPRRRADLVAEVQVGPARAARPGRVHGCGALNGPAALLLRARCSSRTRAAGSGEAQCSAAARPRPGPGPGQLTERVRPPPIPQAKIPFRKQLFKPTEMVMGPATTNQTRPKPRH